MTCQKHPKGFRILFVRKNTAMLILTCQLFLKLVTFDFLHSSSHVQQQTLQHANVVSAPLPSTLPTLNTGDEEAVGCRPFDWRSPEKDNPLLEIMRLRLDETLRLVHRPGLTDHLGTIQMARESKTEELANQGKKGKKKKRRRGVKAKRLAEGFGTGIRAPPSGCHPLLQTWRDNCSVWVSRLFAFACPNHQAIAALQKLGPLVEIGAG